MAKRGWLLAGIVLSSAAVSAAVGFEAGRRYPWAIVDEFFNKQSRAFPGWAARASLPMARYEATTAVVGRQIYLFGGFHESQIRAVPRVDAYDVATDAWTRKADMPAPTTHRNAVVVGDTVWLAGGFVGDDPGKATADVWKYDARTDHWLPGPALPLPRASGVLLQFEGRLHYIGGYGADRDTSREEHWTLDLGAQTAGWTKAPPLPRPRGHASGVVLDGKLYVIGGTVRHDPVQVDVDWVDRYDPVSARWTAVASLPEPRSHAEPSTFVHRGRIVVAGGRNTAAPNRTPDVIISYDAAADRWMPVGRLVDGRVAPLAVPVGDSLYFGGGSDATYNPRDPRLWMQSLAEPWGQLRPMPVALGEVTAAAIGNDVLVIGEGGSQTLRYHTSTDTWDPPQTLAFRPVIGNHHAGETIDHTWYVLGGMGMTTGGRMQMFDASTDRWTLGPDLPWAAGSAASAIIDGVLYVAGGIDRDTTLRTSVKFDAQHGRWMPIAFMPLPRNHAASATDGKRLYVFGGRGPGSGARNDVANGFAETQIYDPRTDRWVVSGTDSSAPLPLPQARGGMGKALYVHGEFWIFGGETRDGAGASPQGVYDRVDIYDPVANRWRAGPPMPTARHGIFPVLIGDRVYVIGGGTHSANSQSQVVEYLDVARLSPPRAP